MGRAIVNILRAMSYGVEVSGQILYHSPHGVVDLAPLNRRQMRAHRTDIQMIFQDPYSSLNPRMNVGQIVEEPLTIHTKQSPDQRRERVMWLMEKVGLSPDYIRRYPHEFSGGQRQRIGIARALATNPKIVVADEPVSALDVSIQAQVVNLMQDLQKEFGLSYIFIAHDLSVVRHISNRIAVMYKGKIVELGVADDIYRRPQHEYSRELLAAVPRPDPERRRRPRLTPGSGLMLWRATVPFHALVRDTRAPITGRSGKRRWRPGCICRRPPEGGNRSLTSLRAAASTAFTNPALSP